MSLNPEHFDEMGEWVSPVVEVGELRLHYGNTRLRFFGDEFKHLDHLEYTDEDGTLGGIMITDELRDALMDKDFPYLFQVYPDQGTREWFLREEIMAIEALKTLIEG